MKIHLYYVYILTSRNHRVLYTGVTNNLERRCSEHRQKKVKGFTSKYNVDRLVYYETFNLIDLAIAREKQIKGYLRRKKEDLIDAFNPGWEDLYTDGKIKAPSIHAKESHI